MPMVHVRYDEEIFTKLLAEQERLGVGWDLFHNTIMQKLLDKGVLAKLVIPKKTVSDPIVRFIRWVIETEKQRMTSRNAKYARQIVRKAIAHAGNDPEAVAALLAAAHPRMGAALGALYVEWSRAGCP